MAYFKEYGNILTWLESIPRKLTNNLILAIL